MATMPAINVNANNLTRQVTMRVSVVGMPRFRARLWCAKQLIRLASVVSGFGIKFEDFEKTER